MGSIYTRLILLFLLMCSAGLLGRWLFGPPGAILGPTLVSLYVYFVHARSGLKIIDWLNDFKPENVPLVSGWWDELAARLYKSLKIQLRQQKALSGALSSFRTAAQALPDGVVNLDSSGYIIWFNETAQKHLGLKRSSDTGHPLVNIVRNPEFGRYMVGGNWDSSLKMRAPRALGKILSVQAVSYGDQQTLVLTRDITQIERVEAMRRDFIANVSHELKTPLTVLSGFLETFRDMPLTADQKAEYLELMSGQASRMQNLVEDLLTLSSLETGLNRSHLDPIKLAPIVEQATEDGRQLSNGKHEFIVVGIDPALEVLGVEQELQSAFSNIVTNAVRYTPEGGTIRISLKRGLSGDDESVAMFSVKDTGIGIPPEHIPRLTERFYRVDRGRSRESGGTGLGLAIVKHVVSRHEGELMIDSTPGAGSRFTIQLPLNT